MEFAKWNNETNAWRRAVVFRDSDMFREYLKRFPYGAHSDNARKYILDREFFSYRENKPPYQITSNYGGLTTLTIVNRSSTSIQFSYSGTFASGKENISGNCTTSISIPNGYYRLSATSSNPHTRGEYSLETLGGKPMSVEYYISY